MNRIPDTPLRTGFTTGACATAAASAACEALLTGIWRNPYQIRLPRGQTPEFRVEHTAEGPGWKQASVRKDAGDDPDVTHGALIVARVSRIPATQGIRFVAGPGVGTVRLAGLPVEIGEPAINPVPRQMMRESLTSIARKFHVDPSFRVELSVPGGEDLALRTWNPRLGIEGGISILGTTGIVRPYSCSAWIASIHRGIDVARANCAMHVIGSTGSTSERVSRQFYGLVEWQMLDMGDFVGGMLKYLRRHPIPKLTIAGGFGKLVKMSQGATDLHSSRSQVDFESLGHLAASTLADATGELADQVTNANTASHALQIAGNGLAREVARIAAWRAEELLDSSDIDVEVIIVDRSGNLIARYSRVPFPQSLI